MKEKLKQLFGLFGAFAVVGVTTFGGGYAMLPALQREVVEKRRWASEEEVMDWYAIGQCTPGVIAVNTATFVGQKQAGIWGGIFATLGVVFPSLVIIMIIAAFIQNFAHLPAVQNAFAGIRVCVCVLILNAVVKLWKKSVVDWKTFLIFLLVFAGSVFLNISPVLYVLGAAVAGLIAAAGFAVVRISLLQEGTFRESGRFADLFFWKGLLLAAVIWVLTNVVKPTKKLHPIVYIAASAVAGIVFSFAGA